MFSVPAATPDEERDFAARYESGVEQTLPYIAPIVGGLVVLFALWDYWLDAAGARHSLLIRVGFVMIAALAFSKRLAPLSGTARAAFIYWMYSLAVVFATFRISDGLLYGLPGLLVGPFLAALLVHRVSTFIYIIGLPFLAFIGLGWQYAPRFEFVNGVLFHLLAFSIALLVLLQVRFLRWTAFSLERKMMQAARTDPLTGLHNRGFIDELGEREIERAIRHDRALAIAMLDIDHFKNVNDTYGHDVGDLVLRTLARIYRENLRAIDHVGRFGGEEFACILPEADADEAKACFERLRAIVESTSITTPMGDIHITISIGIALLNEERRSWDQLIKAADIALYEAKNKGRNRVVLGGDSQAQSSVFA